MLGDVDHGAVRFPHEEPAPAPFLIGQRIDDLRTRVDGAFMDLVDVVDLDRHVGMDVGVDVQLHHAQLHLTLVGTEEVDPVQPVAAVEANHLVVERSALGEPVGANVRLDPLDGNDWILKGRRHRRLRT